MIHMDGSSLGNPGPGGAAFVVLDRDGRVIHRHARRIGHCTNNQAEYMALLDALAWARDNDLSGQEIEIWTDSELVCEQIAGRYRAKNPRLRELLAEARALLCGMKVRVVWVEREANRLADSLARRAATEAKKTRREKDAEEPQGF